MAVLEYKCPNCGGSVNFDSGLQQMKCPYCDSAFDIEALKSYNEDINAEAEQEIEWAEHKDIAWGEGEQEKMRLYLCNSCAGEIVADDVTMASNCPFCGSSVILKGQLADCTRPDCIIPFKLNKKDAIAALAQHVKGKRLLPRCFKSSKKLNEVTGIYVPFWLFDAEVYASARYQATTVRFWSDSQFNYTETSYFHVTRQGDMAFDNVPVNASSKMPSDMMESLEPFDAKDIVDFETAYLAGYLADKFEFCAEHSISRAKERIKSSTEAAFDDTVTGYASVTPQYCNVSLKNSSVKYVLLPVWVLKVDWREKSYLFAMNGQSGKFVGNLPVDWGIFWLWFAVLAGIITVLSLFVISLL